mmetsp:Transcript_77185/g.120651  ORF Transcript_77185/g.120651 Transcript_77185/m.120651 type:complete len:220 (-) Transcript_77185:1044-1703(-)
MLHKYLVWCFPPPLWNLWQNQPPLEWYTGGYVLFSTKLPSLSVTLPPLLLPGVPNPDPTSQTLRPSVLLQPFAITLQPPALPNLLAELAPMLLFLQPFAFLQLFLLFRLATQSDPAGSLVALLDALLEYSTTTQPTAGVKTAAVSYTLYRLPSLRQGHLPHLKEYQVANPAASPLKFHNCKHGLLFSCQIQHRALGLAHQLRIALSSRCPRPCLGTSQS